MFVFFFFFFQAEDGIRDAQESRGLGDVYKRQYQRRVRGSPTHTMHPFCFTLPYGALLIAGGVMGALSGSKVSLLMGTGCGAVTCWMGSRSLQAFGAGKGYTVETIVCLLIAMMVAGAMAMRYMKTGAIMPAGMVACISFAMCLFLIFRLVSPVPPKKTEALKD
eukprot:TRINITY_DN2392_c0_g1_i6.p1 TRINITY_DN2392_c0_g1~~TRINITY_DN2392_c0_g1_i6.p1  ORF type:complete len:164 (+),score=49.27 TRINITY_DN2392_c0_g1_i6:117-608(+)